MQLTFAALTALSAVFMADPMPVAQQNAVIQKYCAVCHTDSARNGGLTLQHFDAGNLDPSLAAMLVSKLNGGAFGAAGVPLPDKATQDSLAATLTSASAGSQEWTVNQTQDAATASILRRAKPTSLYRLVLTCRADSRQGEMQLSWSPSPRTGNLSVSFDGKPPLTYQVEGVERMGNGTNGTTGPASTALETAQPMPLQTLTIANLFPGETVSFPFNALSQPARQALSPCFGATGQN